MIRPFACIASIYSIAGSKKPVDVDCAGLKPAPGASLLVDVPIPFALLPVLE